MQAQAATRTTRNVCVCVCERKEAKHAGLNDTTRHTGRDRETDKETDAIE